MQNGKAENLDILSAIRGINVPRFVVLHPGMSENEQIKIIRGFLEKKRGTVAVRSSAAQEDSVGASFAGMYTTKLSVPANLCDIRVAIEEVRASGAEKGDVVSHYVARRSIELNDTGISVIIQEMVDADMSGVVFSHSLTKPDGYYVVSVSDGLGEKIVGGTSNGILIRIARGVNTRSLKEKWLKKIVVAMRAIEKHFQSTSLDVEFAFKNGTLYILQCRPITTTTHAVMDRAPEARMLEQIKSVNKLVASRFRGDVLGDMIDINPVELLGVIPKPLDISIFKYLFADKIVERVRRDMGYDPLEIGVLRVVEGKPYVSMRAAAFSFRPCGIPDEIYEQMFCVYRNMLVKNPALQSRVEFDVFAMGYGEKLERVMEEAQFNNDEKSVVRKAFLRIDKIFSQVSVTQTKTFNTYATNYEQYTASLSDASLSDILEHVAHGTEMFARVARLAFYWKNRFEEFHPQENLNSLISGHIHSVNGQLQSDLVACQNGMITREKIIEWYGHLRPGQFSIFGESYADDPNAYLFAQMGRSEVAQSQKHVHAFEDIVEFRHIVTFMEARERMKFLFSQSLHLFATKLKYQLARQGISECDASQVSWDQLWMCLNKLITLKANYAEHEPPVLLPDVIIPGLTDLRVITFSEAMPSYITNSIVKARVCVLEQLSMKIDVRGALVLLPNADPGYDFLFHSGAVGIITKVGGPASHMCIRSIELQMPACIGCGESVYQKLATAHNAILDCDTRQIIVL